MKLLNIPFSQAFAHVAAGGFSFWGWVILAVIIAALAIYAYVINAREGNPYSPLYLGLAILVLGLAFFYRAGEVSVNTTPEQAARGVYIGY